MKWIFYVPMHLFLVLWKGIPTYMQDACGDISTRTISQNGSVFVIDRWLLQFMTIVTGLISFFFYIFLNERLYPATKRRRRRPHHHSSPSLSQLQMQVCRVPGGRRSLVLYRRGRSRRIYPSKDIVYYYIQYIYMYYIWPLTEFRASTSKTHQTTIYTVAYIFCH